MKNMTKQEYQDYINKKTPNSSLFKDICFAFLIGGLICIIGQLIGDGFKSMGLDKETAAASTSVVMVF